MRRQANDELEKHENVLISSIFHSISMQSSLTRLNVDLLAFSSHPTECIIAIRCFNMSRMFELFMLRANRQFFVTPIRFHSSTGDGI